MARLSTPSHPCEIQFSRSDGSPAGRCRRDSYRKLDGKWTCKPCRHRIETARERQQDAQEAAFVVVGRSHVTIR
jgi:hypothetical protein